MLLAVAGNDTTRTAISHGVNLLAHNPEQRAIWQADVDGVTSAAVEEIVRVGVAGHVHASNRHPRRHASATVDLDEGDKVVMFYGAANRDPRVFDDPERFDVRRYAEPARRLRRSGPALLSRRPPGSPRAGRGVP